jgi:4-diphosphocytidyl-2-C-methyl-D-erythritol kinase
MTNDVEQIEVLAPAKLNLFLHITGRRDDGFHLLESLFVFCDFGDRLTISEAPGFGLTVTGPFEPIMAELCPDENDNLILKAAKKLANFVESKGGVVFPVQIDLEKNIPIAAGVGGGSSDAAMVLKALIDLWGVEVSTNELHTLALQLGADVPAALSLEPKWVTGIGDKVEHVEALPSFYVVLVNPCVPLSTPDVFNAFAGEGSGFDEAKDPLISFSDLATLKAYLASTKNSLEKTATNLEPVIGDVLESLSNQQQCLLSRMSGSGPTCFGVFEGFAEAQEALEAIESKHPDWWVEVASIMGK